MWRLIRPIGSPSISRGLSQAMGKPNLRVGEEIFGYRVKRVEPVEEFSAVAIELDHESSGAKHTHVWKDDDNNLFNVSLRTTPQDNTGVAHILEHLVLCGSERYLCRDPFMKMTSRSLAT